MTETSLELGTISRGDIIKISNRARRFFEEASNPNFLSKLDPSTAAHQCVSFLTNLEREILKFRVIIITDNVLSARVKSITLDPILDINTSVEIWDLNRFRNLSISALTRPASQ